MPSKKYRTYSKKEKINTVEDIKESLMDLECDITKIHQNLKSIYQEIYFLYDAMSFSKSSEPSSSEEIEEKSQRNQVYECYQPKNRKVKHRRRSQIIE